MRSLASASCFLSTACSLNAAEVILGVAQFFGIAQGIGHQAARVFFGGRSDGDQVFAAAERDFADGNFVGLEHGGSNDRECLDGSLGIGHDEVGFLEKGGR